MERQVVYFPSEKINPKIIDEVINKTIASIQEGKSEIFEVTEIIKNEEKELEEELERLKKQISKIIKEVDMLENKYRQAKARLANVSKNFDRYSERNIKDAYEQANDFKELLNEKNEKEKALRKERDSIERRLKNLKNMVERAENTVSQLGAIESYLTKELGGLQKTLDDLEKRKDLGIKIIRAQEEERRRVAREIHDGPAQGLANMVLRAEYCEKLIDSQEKTEVIKEELSDLKGQVRESLKSVRKIIYDLRPMTLDDLGLIPAVRRLIQGINEETQIEGELKVFGEQMRLHKDLEIALFRTLQEAVNNIRKHSSTKRFWIKVDFSGEQIQVSVKDEGKGFDLESELNNLQGERFGLSNMRERIMSLGGEISINSKPGEGTKIFIKVSSPGKDESS